MTVFKDVISFTENRFRGGVTKKEAINIPVS